MVKLLEACSTALEMLDDQCSCAPATTKLCMLLMHASAARQPLLPATDVAQGPSALTRSESSMPSCTRIRMLQGCHGLCPASLMMAGLMPFARAFSWSVVSYAGLLVCLMPGRSRSAIFRLLPRDRNAAPHSRSRTRLVCGSLGHEMLLCRSMLRQQEIKMHYAESKLSAMPPRSDVSDVDRQMTAAHQRMTGAQCALLMMIAVGHTETRAPAAHSSPAWHLERAHQGT